MPYLDAGNDMIGDTNGAVQTLLDSKNVFCEVYFLCMPLSQQWCLVSKSPGYNLEYTAILSKK